MLVGILVDISRPHGFPSSVELSIIIGILIFVGSFLGVSTNFAEASSCHLEAC